ncbi:hypothetical protein [Vibrio hippocampi]|uniref:Antitoxin Xre/MbcA/ParS-like toxin-binding domain-containing protein n=1 Tax=Vibrio hippocampi TaxID=654686 RepID=A0ABM8ZFK3_9VIBR|nr:hypothetical protein [Vibrio hippocampi]CAH0525404.1 hypothetical protein VHP8226_00958 [Vibrio hippocampi]
MKKGKAWHLLAAWGVMPHNIDAILPENNEAELQQRKQYILAINECLKLLYRNGKEQKAFMHHPSKVVLLDGRKPIETITSGKIDDLALVHRSIRSMVCI